MKPSLTAKACPPLESWRGLLEGESSADRSSLEEHLGECEACQSKLDAMAGSLELTTPRHPRPDLLQFLGPIAGSDEDDGFREEPRPTPRIAGLSGFEEVGRGGMGIVYRAWQEDLHRFVAVKVGSRLGIAFKGRHVREVRAMARLRHPNVVIVHGTGSVEGCPYIVMEWVAGGTLQDRIDVGPMPPLEAARIVADLAEAVAELHALGIVHRDLKPANVLIDAGPPLVPKITDFGLALDDDGQNLTGSGMVLGTPSYMAPEQTGLVDSLGPAGPSADIHALGAILFAILTGGPPYRGDSTWETLSKVARGLAVPLRAIRPDVPRPLESIVLRCMQVAPNRRYASARDLADDLSRFLQGQPVEAMTACSRRRAQFGAMLALVAMVGVAASVLQTRKSPEPPAKPRVVETTPPPPKPPLVDPFVKLDDLMDRVRSMPFANDRPPDQAERALLTETRDCYRSAPIETAATLLRVRNFARSTEPQGKYLKSIAQSFRARGLLGDAILAYQASVAVQRYSLRLDPAATDRESALFSAEDELFEILDQQGDLGPAETLMRESLVVLGSGVDQPYPHDYRKFNNLGLLSVVLAKQDKFEEADLAAAEALTVIERLRATRPDDAHLKILHQIMLGTRENTRARADRAGPSAAPPRSSNGLSPGDGRSRRP